MHRHLIALTLVVGLLSACGGQATTPPKEGARASAAAPAPASASVASATPAPAETPAPTEPPSAASTEPPSAAPTAAFPTIKLSGTGTKVPKFTIPEGSAAIATMTYSGSANFIVHTLAADGSTNDGIVNVIGRYAGTVLFDADASVHSVAFSIQSSGPWTITIRPVASARSWDGLTRLTGKGDDVVLVDPATSGLTTATITYRGPDNFIVHSYGANGRDGLANEIGNWSGQVQLTDGTFLLEVLSSGTWSISEP